MRTLIKLPIVLLFFQYFPAHGQSEKSAQTVLQVLHTPNPAVGVYDPERNAYRWPHSTAITNTTNTALKITRFGIYYLQNNDWVLHNLGGEDYTEVQFARWYDDGDTLIDGWLQPGQTAASASNWSGWGNSLPPAAMWKYAAVDSAGNVLEVEAPIELNPAPVPVAGGTIIFPKTYLYHEGDNPAWAAKSIDESSWQVKANPSAYPQEARVGIRWLRVTIEVSPELQNKPLGLYFQCRGGAEFYLDGKLLHRFGAVGDSLQEERAITLDWYPMPRSMMFVVPEDEAGKPSKHTVAIRHSSYFLGKPGWQGVPPELNWGIADLQQMIATHAGVVKKAAAHELFLIGIFLAFGLLHGLMFIYYPKMNANLYFSLLSLSTCLFVYFNFQDWFFVVDAEREFWSVRLGNCVIGILLLLLLRFTYLLIYPKLPRQFYGFALFTLAFLTWNWLRPFQLDIFGNLVALGFLIEIVRAIISARMQKRTLPYDGSGIILVGVLIAVVAAVYQILTLDWGVLPVYWQYIDFPILFYAGVAMMLSISVFLSRNFAHTNRRLSAKLVEVQKLSEKTLLQQIAQTRLEIENARKTKELEGARELQLSMLPKQIPALPELDIAVYMQPATEVGGDYYDFMQTRDGKLTVVIGDATGHGLNAGMMVASTKSLLNALAHEPDPVKILQQASPAIKAMGFPRLYMAMTIVKYADGKMTLAGAGMPYALVHRAGSGEVTEVKLKGMPLGGFADFRYQKTGVELNQGDTLLLLSDGLPELFNAEGEEFGDDRVRDALHAVADQPAAAIIDHLVSAGNAWRGDVAQSDDVTLVVLKMQE